MAINRYEVRFHVADNEVCYAHWDSLSVNADCISTARYKAAVRIKEEFDFPASAVDVMEVYTESGMLVKRYDIERGE